MAKILIVGCGDLGLSIAKLLSAQHAVYGLKRQAITPIPNLTMLQGDVTQASSLAALHTLKPEFIIYCVAADAQTDAAYQAQYVTGLANVLATQQANPALRHVFFVSSTRVYGRDDGVCLDEATPAKPNDFGGERLLEAEQLLAGLACPTTVLRLSGIYGPGRVRMIKLATSQAWPAQNSWTNRIHRDDAAAFTVMLLEKVLAGQLILPCYIVSDDAPAAVHEVLAWLAGQLQLSTPPPGQQAVTGKRLSNRLMRSTGFVLRYPNYQAGYRALLTANHEQ